MEIETVIICLFSIKTYAVGKYTQEKCLTVTTA